MNDQYVKIIFWQEVLRGTVPPFVLYTFHSDFLGALLLYPGWLFSLLVEK